MPVILSLDTSTEACSCALQLKDKLIDDYAVIPRQHAHNILPMISTMLLEEGISFKDLDAVAFGRGPGSFTGLRIAAGVCQGIAFGADLPVIPVSTLAAMALQVHETTGARLILSSLDARIDEVYWALFKAEGGKLTLLGEEYLCKPELMNVSLLDLEAGELAAVGSGLAYLARFPEAISSRITSELPEILPHAAYIGKLALQEFQRSGGQAAEDVQPLYLRDKVTQ